MTSTKINPRALIVEDHEGTCRAPSAVFRRKGFRVDTAGTLAEGLAMLAPQTSCMILDLMGPDGAGEWLLVNMPGAAAGAADRRHRM